MVCIIFLALARAALLGVGRRGGFSSHNFLMCPEWLSSSHKLYCLFLQGVSSNTLAFWENIEVSTPLLGFPPRLVVSEVFREGSKVVRKFDVTFPSSWVLFHPMFLTLSALFYRLLRHPTARMLEFLWDYHPLVPCVTGALKFLEGLLCDFKQCPGSLIHALYSCCPVTIGRMSSLHSDRIYWVAVFTLTLYSRIEIHRGDRIIVLVLFFGGFITNLPCHIVTLQSDLRII